jgi:hypothetical protein
MRNRRRLKFWALLVCVAALWLAPTSSIAADPLELAKRDWSVKAPDSLAGHPPSNESVAALLDELSESAEVDSVQFADLHHSGTFSMVVEEGATRCGGSDVVIVDRTPDGFEIYRTEEEGRPQDDELIEDANQDGNFEVVLDTTYIFHECVSWDTVFPVIYAWTGTGYSSVRNGFRKFYQRKLEQLASKLAAIDAKQKARAACQKAWASAVHDPRCDPASLAFTADEGNEENWRIEAAAIERLLGLRANAGLAYAIDRFHSDDCSDRLLAAQILGDIPTAEARSYLITLSRDHCRIVASAAQRWLKSAPPHPDEKLPGEAFSFKEVEAVAAQQQ